MPSIWTRALLLLVALSIPVTAVADPLYTMTNIGTLGGITTRPHAINNAGHITGESQNANFDIHAFFWNGTSMQDLGTVGGSSSVGYGINDAGHITGESPNVNNQARAFVWNGTSMQNLGAVGLGRFSGGRSINDAGRVAGSAQIGGLGGGSFQAFVWNGIVVQQLTHPLGAAYSAGFDINNAGQVTGEFRLTGGDTRAFFSDGFALQDIGTLGGLRSGGSAINNAGQITGSAEIAGGRRHAFIWNGTSMADLGTLGGQFDSSGGADINAAGDVVGIAYKSGDDLRAAFLWQGGTMYDLNTLIDPNDPLKPQFELIDAVGINDAGQILALGLDLTSLTSRAILLTPVPVPPAEHLLISGVAGLGLMARLRPRRRMTCG